MKNFENANMITIHDSFGVTIKNKKKIEYYYAMILKEMLSDKVILEKSFFIFEKMKKYIYNCYEKFPKEILIQTAVFHAWKKLMKKEKIDFFI